MKYSILFIFSLLFVFNSQGQETILSLSDAIEQAIAQNPSIQIQKKEIQRASNNVFEANAGKGVVLNAISELSYQNSLTEIQIRTFQDNPEKITLDEVGVQNFNGTLGIQADYVLYDGGAGTFRFSLLEGLSKLEQARQESLVNDIALSVTNIYLELLKLQNQEAFLQRNIETSNIRIAKTEDRKAFGKASRLDVLQLQTQLNEDKTALDQVRLVQTNLFHDLNFLMGTDLEGVYQLRAVQVSNPLPDMQVIQTDIQNQNPQVQLSAAGVEVASLEQQVAQTNEKPVVGIFGNVGYLYQNNDLQQVAQLHNLGVLVGVRASYNLFDGGVRKNQIQNAQIGTLIAQDQKALLIQQLTNQALQARNQIQLLETQLGREEASLAVAEEAYVKVQDLFEVGKADNVQLREIQLAVLNAQLRIDQIKVDLIKSHMQIEQIRGQLI